MSAAHFLAKVGRLGVDRCQGINRAERRRQPGQTAAVKAALEELRGVLGASSVTFTVTYAGGPEHASSSATVSVGL